MLDFFEWLFWYSKSELDNVPKEDSLKLYWRTRQFWTDYLFVTESPIGIGKSAPYYRLEDFELEFRIGNDYILTLSFDECLMTTALGITVQDRKQIWLADNDRLSLCFDVFRWEELETICRALAIQKIEYSHPGFPLLLLHRFAPVCRGDDEELIIYSLEAAWKTLDLFSGTEITSFIDEYVVGDSWLQWRPKIPKGWFIEIDEEYEYSDSWYSTRSAESSEFPFSAWEEMLQCARNDLSQLEKVKNDATQRFIGTGDVEEISEIINSLELFGYHVIATSLEENPTLANLCWVVESIHSLPIGTLSAKYISSSAL